MTTRMERSTANRKILLARTLQILLGVIVTGIAIGATVTNGYENWFAFSAIYLSSATTLFGILGLFGISHRPDAARADQLALLVLAIDCCAMVSCLAACICLGVQVLHDGWQKDYLIPGSVFAFLTTFAIVPVMVQTLRAWWDRVLHANAVCATKARDHEADSIQMDHNIQQTVPAYYRQQVSHSHYDADAFKSPISSKPHSILSGPSTLYYPDIGHVTQNEPPTRAPSHISRVEVGSKIEEYGATESRNSPA